jgi:tetratricopeptide (TPR) repeat protein
VHKQDTARLNANALAERIAAGGLKQWWIARQIEVDTKTVNRWLTGKVKRISRDNLNKLSSTLGCAEEEICFADEGDVRATRAEQNAASNALLDPHTKKLFERHEDYLLYENLLKATMHPDMTVRQLGEMYKQLMWLGAKQNKLVEARRYALLALEYAGRSGDVSGEISTRGNLIVLDAQNGQLSEAARQLEQHASFCESVGEERAQYSAYLNLAHVYRLLGDFHKAIGAVNRSFPMVAADPNAAPLSVPECNAANIARELGWFELARRLQVSAHCRPQTRENVRSNAETQLYIAELDSLLGHTSEAASAAEPLLEELRPFTSFGESYFIASAGIFRRARQYDRALQQINEGLVSSFTRNYEHPFLFEEQARLAAARSDWRQARTLRRKANAAFSEFGMSRRVIDDPALEIGQIFEPPARLRIRHWTLLEPLAQPLGA